MPHEALPLPPDSSLVADALRRGAAALRTHQLAGGMFDGEEDAYPLATSSHVVCSAFMGTLQDEDAAAFATYLVHRQRPDGGFPPNLAEDRSDVSTTAKVVAALTAAGTEPKALARANAWLGQQGGMETVLARLFSHSDQTALYCAMAGLIPAERLPVPHLSFFLLPPAMDLLNRRLNGGVLMGMASFAAIVRKLRADQGKPPSWIEKVRNALEYRAVLEYTLQFQNPNGSWNDVTVQTDLTAAGLFAMGQPVTRGPVAEAVRWLREQHGAAEEGRRVIIFTSQVWTTAFAVRALLHAGVSRADADMEKALGYLVRAQNRVPMLTVNQPRPGAALTGGWSFEPDNPKMPDCDDSGTVFSALGLALQRDQGEPLSESLQGEVQEAVDRGLPQVLDMQSPSGGWAGFMWDMPSKKPGPMAEHPMPWPQTLAEQLDMLLDPPAHLGDPPVEGLTGRVLWGLGTLGYTADSPVVRHAERFLQHQQADLGGWWGRWMVNYLAATASVLGGLAMCRVDREQPYLQRAIAFVEKHQNPDGGFGETVESYRDASLAGVGPSTAALTGLVTTALLLLGRRETPAVRRAIAYLTDTQLADGSWGGPYWMQVFEPPDGFYWYGGGRWFHPVEALALYQNPPAPPDPTELLRPLTDPPKWPSRRRDEGEWPRAWLAQLRQHGDPVADDLVTEVFSRGEAKAVHQIMGALVRSDEPIPAELPPEVRAYFEATEAMPTWADPALIARGQALFERHGWAAAMALFCSSLPQAYCAANGARVLLLTQGMTRHVYRRVLETAQFLFDTVAPGQLAPGGRGIRAAQKVRLMHASVRHLGLLSERWNARSWGLPVNQEDLAGTLMTFSVVVLDSMRRMGLTLSAEDQRAWLHTWKVLGHFLGVNPDVVPTTVEDGEALMAAIRSNQWRASQQGRQLGSALVECIDGFLPVPLLHGLPPALIRHLAGDACGDLLGLPPARFDGWLIDAAESLERVIGPLVDGEPVLFHWLSLQLMEAVIDVQREGKQTGFRIPEALLHGWSLNSSAA